MAPLVAVKKVTREEVTPAKVVRRFRVIFNAVRTHFRQLEKEVGLGGAQVWALSIIADHPGIGMGDIAEAMDIHQSTASNLVKALQKKDLIAVDKSLEDRRSVCIKLLPSGRKLLAKVQGPFSGVLPTALEELDPAILKRLDKDLDALIRALHADESAAEIPLANL
ncbi:MarR family transcriptional regulator [Rhodoferax sp. GW822-FHT02A01]|uniref:MarR family winged helix-turn-helix transcriptional regulator n=1 Tax=Rhodoferax sp. GW822-FHT02A01 TaxID=3141537 RepID=UPI00315CC2D5